MSSTIMISEPSAHWISIHHSGLKKCLDPSCGERKWMPSSVILIPTSWELVLCNAPSRLSELRSPRLKT